MPPLSPAWANVALATTLAVLGGIREILKWLHVRRVAKAAALDGHVAVAARLAALEASMQALSQDVEDYHAYDVTLWQSAPGEMRRDYLTRAEADTRREELLSSLHDLRDRIAAIEAVLLRR